MVRGCSSAYFRNETTGRCQKKLKECKPGLTRRNTAPRRCVKSTTSPKATVPRKAKVPKASKTPKAKAPSGLAAKADALLVRYQVLQDSGALIREDTEIEPENEAAIKKEFRAINKFLNDKNLKSLSDEYIQALLAAAADYDFVLYTYNDTDYDEYGVFAEMENRVNGY